LTCFRYLIAGNWKMHGTLSQTREYLDTLKKLLGEDPGAEVVVCPPFTLLAEAVSLTRGSPIHVGAQDMFWEDWGPYTGEVSAPMLKDLGCRYVIVGHSERRQLFGEKDREVREKVKAALKNDLIPIVCVGETLEQREQGLTERVVYQQLEGSLEGLEGEEVQRIIVAYEPVWAIGTGRNAEPGDAQEVAAFIKKELQAMYGERALGISLLYGGSVKPENIESYLEQPDIQGALVGGASLDPHAFASIIKIASKRG